MRDATHADHILRWAAFVRAHPRKWKALHTEFINAQFTHHERVLQKLRARPDGAQTIIRLYKIRNVKGYPNLLRTRSQRHRQAGRKPSR